MSTSASSHTRSSSARPTISARVPSSRMSLIVTTSPDTSLPRASTTFNDSLSTTSCPRSSASRSTSGLSATRIFRPPDSTSTVPSSLRPTTTPYADGGCVSLSTSSRSAAMCSRASRSVYESFSFCDTACASCPFDSSRRSSSVRTRFGASCSLRRSDRTSSSRSFACSRSSASSASYAASRRSYSVSSTRVHLPLRATCSGRYLRRRDQRTAACHTAVSIALFHRRSPCKLRSPTPTRAAPQRKAQTRP